MNRWKSSGFIRIDWFGWWNSYEVDSANEAEVVHHFTGTTTSKTQMEEKEPVVDPALAAAPAEIPIEKVAR